MYYFISVSDSDENNIFIIHQVIITLPVKFCTANINNTFRLSMLANDHGISSATRLTVLCLHVVH